MNSNAIPSFFGVAVASLAAGYYLGTLSKGTFDINRVPRKQSKQWLLKKCKEEASRLEAEEEEEEGYDDNNYEDEESDEEIESLTLNDVPGEVRMALVIRQDLGMQKGKIAAQCAHAALSCYRLITDPAKKSYNATMTQRWLRGGQAKITLKCPGKENMDELYAMAIALGVNAAVIHDAGRTQIAAGSATVLGIGPAPKAVLDQITGELKLY